MSRKNRVARNSKNRQYLVQIGGNIRKARQQMAYSQDEFADLVGMSRSYITEIETGKRNISILNLIGIMQGLNVDPNDIIGSIKPR